MECFPSGSFYARGEAEDFRSRRRYSLFATILCFLILVPEFYFRSASPDNCDCLMGFVPLRLPYTLFWEGSLLATAFLLLPLTFSEETVCSILHGTISWSCFVNSILVYFSISCSEIVCGSNCLLCPCTFARLLSVDLPSRDLFCFCCILLAVLLV